MRFEFSIILYLLCKVEFNVPYLRPLSKHASTESLVLAVGATQLGSKKTDPPTLTTGTLWRAASLS